MKLRSTNNRPEGRLLHTDLAERVNLAARRATFARLRSPVPLPQAQQRAEAAVHTFPVVGRERYDRVASALGIEPRDPFTDPRVATFCLRLPEAQVGGNGWHKLILRQAMAGLLPDEVRWRMGKEHLGWSFTNTVSQSWVERAEPMLRTGAKGQSYVLSETMHRYGQDPSKLVMGEEGIEILFLVAWLGEISLSGCSPSEVSLRVQW